jgi:hypothetical protein
MQKILKNRKSCYCGKNTEGVLPKEVTPSVFLLKKDIFASKEKYKRLIISYL